MAPDPMPCEEEWWNERSREKKEIERIINHSIFQYLPLCTYSTSYTPLETGLERLKDLHHTSA